MLTVESRKPKARRSTESSVEKLWAATWTEMGIYSRHMSDHVPGLPDRYLGQGRWVEFKSLWRARGNFMFGEGLSTEQIRTAKDLTAAGDQVFYCAQLDGWPRGKSYVFLRWGVIENFIGQPYALDSVLIKPATKAERMALTEKHLYGLV